MRHEQAARPRSGPATGLATEAQQMAEEYEAKLAQVGVDISNLKSIMAGEDCNGRMWTPWQAFCP